MLLPTAAEMREFDRIAIEEYAIPGLLLMENAGRETVEYMVANFGAPRGRGAAILLGPGNNGGDGLVIARHLHRMGAELLCVFLVAPEGLRGDAAINAEIVARLGLERLVVSDETGLAEAGERIRALHGRCPLLGLVDALFGIGLARPLEGRFRGAVELLNRLADELGCPVTAVDIPSGLDADRGALLGAAVCADLTVTYGCAKPGLFHHGGGDCVGQLQVADIGIPAPVVAAAGIRIESQGAAEVRPLRRRRSRAAHKGGQGHVLIVAGSTGKTGAAILAAQGALRAGAGLVSLVTPRDLNPVFEATLVEAMTIPLDACAGALCLDDFEAIRRAAEGKAALVLGPGLGAAAGTVELARRLYAELPLPMVVDADGLGALAGRPELLAAPGGPRILTPHPGEMARLMGGASTSGAVQADRCLAAAWPEVLRRELSPGSPALYTVLKGAGTVISPPNGRCIINTSGNPGMAAGGMGDVLAGIIGGLLAQGYDREAACRIGVYAHGRAADALAARRGHGYLAAEVAAELPGVWGELGA